MQAYIGNITPIATVDFPNKISLVVFFAGCDFRCCYCYNANILDFKQEFLIDLKNVRKEIENNKNFVDAVVFSGGEPTLQPSVLTNLLRFSKKIGLKTAIETNGSKPLVIKRLAEDIDYISLDIKAPFEEKVFERVTKSKTFFKSSKDVMDNIRKTIDILKDFKGMIEVRTTIVPSLVYRKEDVLEIAKEVKDLNCVFVLQQFRNDLGKLVNKNLANITPPTENFLETLRESCLKAYPHMRIRVRV